MADWFVSSASYAAVPVWAASTAYTVGQFVKPTAPTINAQYVFRCSVAGTSAASEPTWSGAAGNNQTIASGGATFTNVTSQLAYGWNAAAGTLLSIIYPASTSRAVAGDRIFLSSDHSESVSTAQYGVGGSIPAFGLVRILSVNRAGSVPPVEADLQNGAAITSSSSSGIGLNAYCDIFWQGITFTVSATGASAHIYFNDGASSALKAHYFKNCTLRITGTNASQRVTTGATARGTLDNTTVQFGATGQAFSGSSATSFELHWLNTPSAIVGATIPTALFANTQTASMHVTCRGVDLSAINTTLLSAASTVSQQTKVLLDSCKIASGVTRYGTPAAGVVPHDEIELVNCHDGTNILNERHTAAGDVTIDRSTTMTGGAQDDVGAYSLKLVSSSRSDYCTLPLDAFWLDVENTVTGSSKTATVEVISSASLNNTDIKLLLEYMGTSGSSVASFTESLSSVLATSAALPSSSATWNNPPGTPQKQYLRVTFTPQIAGRVRGLVRLGKTLATVWINPKIAIA